MTNDIRFPIGLLFSIIGAMLVMFGILSDPEIYERSLGINLNLYWGLALLVFGGFMLYLAFQFGGKNGTSSEEKKQD